MKTCALKLTCSNHLIRLRSMRHKIENNSLYNKYDVGNNLAPEGRYYDGIGENCGLFGIFGDEDAVRKTYFGLHSLQHRGQESAGIATSDGELIPRVTG